MKTTHSNIAIENNKSNSVSTVQSRCILPITMSIVYKPFISDMILEIVNPIIPRI